MTPNDNLIALAKNEMSVRGDQIREWANTSNNPVIVKMCEDIIKLGS